jgi:hypothetical protein
VGLGVTDNLVCDMRAVHVGLQVVRTGRQLTASNGKPYDIILVDEAQVRSYRQVLQQSCYVLVSTWATPLIVATCSGSCPSHFCQSCALCHSAP